MPNSNPPLFTQIVPGAVISTTGVYIPFGSLTSLSAGAGDSDGLEAAWSLVETLSAGLAAITGHTQVMSATSTQRVVDSDTIRKDYTFRFNVGYNLDTLNAETTTDPQ